MTLNELFQIPPYGLAAEDKEAALAEILSKLTRHHYEHCPEYHKIIDVLGFDVSVRHSCEQQPFLPVRPSHLLVHPVRLCPKFFLMPITYAVRAKR